MLRLGRTWRVDVCFVLVFLGLFSVPALSQQLPVLLIYGFQPLAGFRPTQLWEDFAEHLSGSNVLDAETITLSGDHEFYYLPAADAERRDVFMSHFVMPYEPTIRDIFFYTRRLADEIGFMKSELGVLKIDVVGHSVGGLLARTYAEIDDFADMFGAEDFKDYSIVYGGEISTLITLATPNHGTGIATLGELFGTLSRQLAPGSDYLRLLNAVHWISGRLHSLNPSVRYISMAGQTCLGCGLRSDQESCLRSCIDEGLSWNGSDLVTMMASAYLPEANNCALIGFDHVRSRSDLAVASAIEQILNGERVPATIYAPELQEYQPTP
ncbi:lipase family alpha/beta hydrolase [Candidatus Bipolaricaulota bacterium]